MVKGGVIAGLVLLVAAVWWFAGADERRLNAHMEAVLERGGPVEGRTEETRNIETAVLLPDGRTLRLSFVGGAPEGECAESFTGRSVESSRAVVVAVVNTTRFGFGDRICSAVGYSRTLDVTLDRPLDGRAVLDGASGHPIDLSASSWPSPHRDLAPTPS
ncbi:hypothetical protein [Herbidospora sp. NBRC 101105]|uniref:hypothetical protein n=1 Tax=Herbidospora sp. NBRC 101105 TaxID=3032195 RepID=UPI0024A248B9|nr:hypothetical protein [Herbidospora sp. NBRC 101105]GLX99190.1 hypothetical protein Hesp01_71400 [Herbidospora sp. NBRC 101105]